MAAETKRGTAALSCTHTKLVAAGFQGFADAPVDVQTRLFFEAADEVYAELEQALAQDRSVGVETVLSSKKYCPLVESVRARSGFVGLIYVSLSSPAIAQQRLKKSAVVLCANIHV